MHRYLSLDAKKTTTQMCYKYSCDGHINLLKKLSKHQFNDDQFYQISLLSSGMFPSRLNLRQYRGV